MIIILIDNIHTKLFPDIQMDINNKTSGQETHDILCFTLRNLISAKMNEWITADASAPDLWNASDIREKMKKKYALEDEK